MKAVSIFHPDSFLMQKLGLLFDLMLLNFITLLCSIPIFTMGAAVTALYDGVWRLKHQRGSLLRDYFRAFRSNFGKATLLFLPLLLLGLVIGYGALLVYLNYDNGMKSGMFPLIIGTVLWILIISWVFPLQSRFESPILRVYVNAFLCALRYLPRTIIMAVLNLLPIFLAFFATTLFLNISILWCFLWFALSAYLIICLLDTPFRQLTEFSFPSETVGQSDEASTEHL